MIEKKKSERQLSKEILIMENLRREMNEIVSGKSTYTKVSLGKSINISPEMLSQYGKTKMPSLLTFALICDELELDANDVLGIIHKTNK